MKNRIDCDFEERPAYLYSTSPKNAPALEQETDTVQRFGIDAAFSYMSLGPACNSERGRTANKGHGIGSWLLLLPITALG